ncbi:MAG: chromate transporter [Geminicoccaceae bacterium]
MKRGEEVVAATGPASKRPPAAPGQIGLWPIFLAFLLIGATSVGGGVVAYLRNGLVDKHGWIDDPTFVRMLSISQSLPGLNATNMSILIGDRLRGTMGSIVATVAICLPGGLFMFAVGMAYGIHGNLPIATAILHSVAAAAVGLVLAVSWQLGRRSLDRLDDLVFVGLAVVGVAVLHLSVPYVLLGVGALAIFWYRPRGNSERSGR